MAVLLPVSVRDLFAKLTGIIDLPKHVTALDLRMRLDEPPTITLTFHPTSTVDVTSLMDPEPVYRTFKDGPVTKRFRLEEI